MNHALPRRCLLIVVIALGLASLGFAADPDEPAPEFEPKVGDRLRLAPDPAKPGSKVWVCRSRAELARHLRIQDVKDRRPNKPPVPPEAIYTVEPATVEVIARANYLGTNDDELPYTLYLCHVRFLGGPRKDKTAWVVEKFLHPIPIEHPRRKHP